MSESGDSLSGCRRLEETLPHTIKVPSRERATQEGFCSFIPTQCCFMTKLWTGRVKASSDLDSREPDPVPAG